ncbi:endo-1,5-alpha-L-arabinosidase [Aspergillus steynii IBT 23096]|uniref:Arabinan endo-1,5-alpha-L-arabinosidase n=1 Tax=Aspergillus steynii IBT 23096 TaxID=1392250 RepID=A0A2I2GIR7_9EURO|nr:endo-1,5-alpha-L-arabinosidase [Aspergillus steynii IBT 23096]PLB52776.1 endo-1,5-alpha-L-arabinosidase [Aspergillus steynii IBT 23096]
MLQFSLQWLWLASLLCWVTAVPADIHVSDPLKVFSQTKDYPLPNQGNIATHDPSILQYNDNYYMFKGGVHLPIFKSDSLRGPWKRIGTVFDGPSVIQKQNRTRPWAPTTIERNGRFYCFYTISKHGSRNSAIGVASSDSIDDGSWTDHGALINTEEGPQSHIYPYTVSNAIDASFITDQETGKPYLLYGSFWHGIFQVPLSDDLLSVEHPRRPDAKNLAFLPNRRVKPQEGSFMSYREPYYYLWFSHGKCCHFSKGFPKIGQEYSIRVGRSKNVRGPFVDKDEHRLTDGGGTVVYGSNHGVVYAPGGIGVMTSNSSDPDVMYYHYLNASIGLGDGQARLGYSCIKYKDGWPVAEYVPLAVT